MELNTALLLLVALLTLASLLQRLAARTTLPASILLAAAGAVIGGVTTLAERLGSGDPITAAVKAFVDPPWGPTSSCTSSCRCCSFRPPSRSRSDRS